LDVIEPITEFKTKKYEDMLGCETLKDAMRYCIGGHWESLKGFPDYIIYSRFPHLILNVTTGTLVSVALKGGEYKNCDIRGGYWVCKSNRASNKSHIVIAEQFHSNPLNKKIVDHIDGNTQNCNKLNLRWFSESENAGNCHTSNGESIPHYRALKALALPLV
jgi:hypothetical protein